MVIVKDISNFVATHEGSRMEKWNDTVAFIAHKFSPENLLNEDAVSAGMIVTVIMGIVVLAYMLPVAIGAFYETDTSAWKIGEAEDAKVVNMYWLLPLFAVLAGMFIILQEIRN